MKITLKKFAAVVLCASTLLLGACTALPTEKQSVSDMRPQISFKATGDVALGARVVVDGLDMGSVSEFLDGVAAVRVLPGTHKLTVITGAAVLLDEKIYLGDGVNRSYIVK